MDKSGKTSKSGVFQDSYQKPTHQDAPSATDQIELSSLGQRLTALAIESPEHVHRVEELSALVESGRYQVDSDQLSRRLIESMY